MTNDIDPELQSDLQQALSGKGKPLTSQAVSKEEKLRLLADVLRCLDGLTLSQQRQVLRFAIFTLEVASKRFWRKK